MAVIGVQVSPLNQRVSKGERHALREYIHQIVDTTRRHPDQGELLLNGLVVVLEGEVGQHVRGSCDMVRTSTVLLQQYTPPPLQLAGVPVAAMSAGRARTRTEKKRMVFERRD